MLPNGEVTLFDDGSSPPIHHQSRAIRIALDFATHTATLSVAYTHASPLLAASQGNMQTLADGNSVVGYGGVPQISEYSPGGTLLLDAHLPYDMAFYRSYRYPWSATPSDPPSVLANLNSSSEQTIVHASWNGATTVASWRVLAGKSAHALAVASVMPASGFESSLILPTKVRLRVRAGARRRRPRARQLRRRQGRELLGLAGALATSAMSHAAKTPIRSARAPAARGQ